MNFDAKSQYFDFIKILVTVMMHQMLPPMTAGKNIRMNPCLSTWHVQVAEYDKPSCIKSLN